MPKVSVIMSVYNCEKFLAQTIESVLNQSFLDFEFIIIDDCSTDSSKKIIENFQLKDKRIRFFANKQNLGLTKNLNFGISVSIGEFIARVDGDDYWVDADKLQKQVSFLQNNPKVGLLGSYANMLDSAGKMKYVFRPPVSNISIRKQILIRNCFIHSSVMCRRQSILSSKGYSENEAYIEDYGLWLRIGQKFEMANLPEIMVNYRINLSGITQTRRIEQMERIFCLIKKYRNFYPNYWFAVLKWTWQFWRAKF